MGLDEKDQQRMERQIRAAFAGVSRADGVSWSEADVIDDWGTEEACAAARAQDRDRSWEQLVDDPNWNLESGLGRFSFLDAIGFRYYLAPAMIRAVRSGQDSGIQFHLMLSCPGGSGNAYKLEQWSQLDARQRSCIAAFLSHMAAWADHQGWEVERDWWREALASYWDTQQA
jgi:hypothetical protein